MSVSEVREPFFCDGWWDGSVAATRVARSCGRARFGRKQGVVATSRCGGGNDFHGGGADTGFVGIWTMRSGCLTFDLIAVLRHWVVYILLSSVGNRTGLCRGQSTRDGWSIEGAEREGVVRAWSACWQRERQPWQWGGSFPRCGGATANPLILRPWGHAKAQEQTPLDTGAWEKGRDSGVSGL